MRQIVIDELGPEDINSLEGYLKKQLDAGDMAGIFWLPLPDDLLAPAQRGHEECGPFVFGIELTDKLLQAELLVRGRNNLHCSCISYASRAQREFLCDFIDRMLEENSITS